MKALYHAAGGTNLHLARAILIYENTNAYAGSAPAAVATIHSVQNNTLQPGQAVNREQIEQLSLALMEQETKSGRVKNAPLSPFIPAGLVALTSTMMAWVCPSARRPIYFSTGNEKLNALDGKIVCHPHLFFVATTRQLKVFALPSANHPTADTKLCVAPYHNTYTDGGLCLGTARMPKIIHPSAIPGYERGFFMSSFTHTNTQGAALTKHPEGHLGLWREMTKATTFPAKYLAPTKITVTQAIK